MRGQEDGLILALSAFRALTVPEKKGRVPDCETDFADRASLEEVQSGGRAGRSDKLYLELMWLLYGGFD